MFGPALVSLSFALSGPLRPAVHTPSRAATPEMGFRDNKVAVGVASVGGVGVGLLLGGPAQFLVTKAASVVAASIPAQIALSGALGLAPTAVAPMLVAGFLAPWPYNYWRLKRYGQSCH